MKNEIETLLSAVYSQPVRIKDSRPCGGGCINETLILSLSNGERVFVKHNASPPPHFFAREAEGLNLLRQAANGPRAPRVIALPETANPHFLILEYLEEGAASSDFYVAFGRALAALHRVTNERYGLAADNYIGKTPQRNTPEGDPVTFFRKHRLEFQIELARRNGLLPAELCGKLELLCGQLERFLAVAGEKPALLHGDLWPGNCFAGVRQEPCVFDPAVYYGLREADLAMTELFGRLPERFYAAYAEAFPLAPGYEERKQIFNLYHLLNHVNLFGGSYLSAVNSVARHFVG